MTERKALFDEICASSRFLIYCNFSLHVALHIMENAPTSLTVRRKLFCSGMRREIWNVRTQILEHNNFFTGIKSAKPEPERNYLPVASGQVLICGVVAPFNFFPKTMVSFPRRMVKIIQKKLKAKI